MASLTGFLAPTGANCALFAGLGDRQAHAIAHLNGTATRVPTLHGAVGAKAERLVERARPWRVPERPESHLGERLRRQAVHRVADELAPDPPPPGVRMHIDRPDLPHGRRYSGVATGAERDPSPNARVELAHRDRRAALGHALLNPGLQGAPVGHQIRCNDAAIPLAPGLDCNFDDLFDILRPRRADDDRHALDVPMPASSKRCAIASARAFSPLIGRTITISSRTLPSPSRRSRSRPLRRRSPTRASKTSVAVSPSSSWSM